MEDQNLRDLHDDEQLLAQQQQAIKEAEMQHKVHQQQLLLEQQKQHNQMLEQQKQQQILLEQQKQQQILLEQQKQQQIILEQQKQQQILMEQQKQQQILLEQQKQQQLILEQQKQHQQLLEQQKQGELFQLQQAALMEKQREQQAQQQIRLQQELAEKQKNEELFRLQQQALLEKAREVIRQPPPAMPVTPVTHVTPVAQSAPVVSVTLVTPVSVVSTVTLVATVTQVQTTAPPGQPVMTSVGGIRPALAPAAMQAVSAPVSSPVISVPPPPIISKQGMVGSSPEVRLPQALEQALAFKTERAKQVGVRPDEIEKVESEGLSLPEAPPPPVISRPRPPFVEKEAEANDKKSKKDQKNKKKKKKKKRRLHPQEEPKKNVKPKEKKDKEDPDVEIEYIQEELDRSDPLIRQFSRILETFRINEPEKVEDSVEMLRAETERKREQLIADLKKVPKPDDEFDTDSDDDEAKEDDKPKLSKRKMKKLTRLSVAELKQAVARPDVVEMHDVTARDPKLLVLIKATRNTVPVPRHWCFKRKYLQGKRGFEKPPFDLPDFIKKTGIMEMRQALQDKEDQKTLKAKMRERVRPKLGKIDIDYQKLHDAFFKWQTKPKMTIHGNLYYEGKEFETKLKEKKPGDLSDDLRTALGMPVGPNANKVPPPWLIAMQRYGPPPSYPHLKIPGLNAAIPEGCAFGYHAGGWGKPPVDEIGKPLYGDVFGTLGKEFEAPAIEEEVDRTQWGELESESEEESDEDEDEDDEEGKQDETGLVTPAEGLITPSGITSIPTGMETPEMIELRKKRIETEMEGGETPALFTTLPEKRGERVGAAMMGSTHVYDLTAAAAAGGRADAGGVDVALDPSELDLVDTDAMAARYEQTMREQQGGLQKEDLSDMVAEHAAKQKNKRKRQQQDQSKQNKKYKEFKF